MIPTQTDPIAVQIPIALITPNPKQARKRFDPQELEDLTASVKEHGIIQPLLVCPANQDGIHILIAGERRLRAAKGALLTTVPAVIRDVQMDDLAILALVENIIRDDMSPVEEGDAYLELRRKGKKQARIEWLEGLGIPVSGIGTGPVLAKVSVSYLRPIVYPSEVEVRLYAGRVGNTSFVLDSEIVNARDAAERFTEGEFVTVWIDYAASRPVPGPGEGKIVALTLLGGLHHRYERHAA